DLPRFMQLATHFIDPLHSFNYMHILPPPGSHLLSSPREIEHVRYVSNVPGSNIQSEYVGKWTDAWSQIEDLNIAKSLPVRWHVFQFPAKLVQPNRSAASPSIGRTLSVMTTLSTASAATRNLPSSTAPPPHIPSASSASSNGTSAAAAEKRPPPPPLKPKPKSQPEYVTALYDFDAQAENDLCIEGVTKTDSQEDWWAGRLPQNPSVITSNTVGCVHSVRISVGCSFRRLPFPFIGCCVC
ncbi:hypothetical protein PISMIDRAFT_118854, partial [Pisolithus microcarpus 441]